MANIHNGRVLTDAIVAALTAGGLVVGDAQAPADTSQGYVVVYGIPGGTLDGSIGLPDDNATVLYQLTAIGHDRRQCQWVADKARTVILAASLTLSGSRVVQRVSVDILGGTIRDEDVLPAVWYSPDRYRFQTAAA